MTGPVDITSMMQRQLNFSFNDLPYLGEAYMLKEDDPANVQPQARQVVSIRTFKVWDEQDALALEQVLQNVAINISQIYEMERQYVPEKNDFVVYVHWADRYMVNPEMADDIKRIRREAGARRLDGLTHQSEVPVKVTGQPDKE